MSLALLAKALGATRRKRKDGRSSGRTLSWWGRHSRGSSTSGEVEETAPRPTRTPSEQPDRSSSLELEADEGLAPETLRV